MGIHNWEPESVLKLMFCILLLCFPTRQHSKSNMVKVTYIIKDKKLYDWGCTLFSTGWQSSESKSPKHMWFLAYLWFNIAQRMFYFIYPFNICIINTFNAIFFPCFANNLNVVFTKCNNFWYRGSCWGLFFQQVLQHNDYVLLKIIHCM